MTRTQAQIRPRWTWLFFVQLAIVAGAGVLASARRLPAALFSSGVDKLGHFLGLGVLAFLAVSFFGRSRWRRTVVIVAAASVVEELSQRLLPARTFDLGDMAANLAGIGLFGALAGALAPERPQPQRPLATTSAGDDVSARALRAPRARRPRLGSRPAARHGSRQ